MFELKITQASFPAIEWNYEDLKQAVASAAKEYENVVFTPEQEGEARETRARLNRLRNALEDARKDLKARAMKPVKAFEQGVKDVEAPLDKTIAFIDEQLSEMETARKAKKQAEIEALFSVNCPKELDFLTLDKVEDPKWLNKTVSLLDIKEDIELKVALVKRGLASLRGIEYEFEAVDYYKRTLDYEGALDKAEECKRIAEAKAAQKPIVLPESPQNEEQVSAIPEKVYTFTFSAEMTLAQAKALGAYCKAQGIVLRKVNNVA